MLVSDFDYDLPPELIAQEPLEDRAASRLLHLVRRRGEVRDRRFRDLPNLLQPGDLAVFNNTRVFPARLFGRRSGARAQPLSPRNPAAREFLRGRVEVLLTRQLSADAREWQALVRPGRKIGVGEKLYFGKQPNEPSKTWVPHSSRSEGWEEEALEAEVIARGDYGERTLRFTLPGAPDTPDPLQFFAMVERLGHVPLPPYIARPDNPADRERYQTVYARERGSVAAPTAGLHFTPEVLDALRMRGVERADITLHVGLGTFQPVHAERVEDHRLHAESYEIGAAAAEAINAVLTSGRRIVAIGTTAVRTLEHAIRAGGGEIRAGRGEADLFIYPGFDFRAVGALLTNFHLPRSTLLMLVCAFAGRERVLAAYQHAVRERYRFYSYGDCMLIE